MRGRPYAFEFRPPTVASPAHSAISVPLISRSKRMSASGWVSHADTTLCGHGGSSEARLSGDQGFLESAELFVRLNGVFGMHHGFGFGDHFLGHGLRDDHYAIAVAQHEIARQEMDFANGDGHIRAGQAPAADDILRC